MSSTLQQAVSLAAANQPQQAMPLFQEVLRQQPDNPEVYLAFSRFLMQQKQRELACKMAAFGCKLAPTHSELQFEHGQINEKLQNWHAATQAYALALHHADSNSDFFSEVLNKAVRLQQTLHENNQALNLLHQAMRKKPELENSPHFHELLLRSELFECSLETALSTFKQCLQLAPKNPEPLIHVVEALFYLNRPHQLEMFLSCLPSNLPLVFQDVLNTAQALQARLMGTPIIPEWLAARASPAQRAPFSTKGRGVNNMFIFQQYLQALTAHNSYQPYAPPAQETCVVMGDSHILAALGSATPYGILAPRLIMGVKLYHLAMAVNNRFKAMLSHKMGTLDKTTKHVYFSIGEIDCRANEGFLPALANNPSIDGKAFIEHTVKHALDWLAGQLPKHIQGHMLGVPAPYIAVPAQQTPAAEKLVEIVQTVNDILHGYGNRQGFLYHDLYSVSAHESGFAREGAHVDAYHLHSGMYRQLLQE